MARSIYGADAEKSRRGTGRDVLVPHWGDETGSSDSRPHSAPTTRDPNMVILRVASRVSDPDPH
jgi:hypothetical protein